MSDPAHAAKVAAHWDSVQKTTAVAGPRRWWEFAPLVSYINALVDGSTTPDFTGGFHRRIAGFAAARPVRLAVSVGAGVGVKEMALVRSGVVERFELFELSSKRIADGQARAAAMGIGDRVVFRQEDAFAARQARDYDMVYWNNALHHMPDVDAAIAWSGAVLKPGGLFAMDDYVGPDRWQFPAAVLEAGTAWRSSLPERLLADPDRPGQMLPREVRNRSVESMIRMDPSEAADSGRTLACLAKRLPQAEVIPTGGGIYQVAMTGIIANLHLQDDRAAIDAAIALDRSLAARGHSTFAVAFATV